MNSLKPNLLTPAIAVFFLCLFGCTYSHTAPPDFNGKQIALFDSLKKVYSFEDANAVEKKTSGTGGDNTVLTITFINGKNIPADADGITTLAKQIAVKIKSTLKNPKEIERYTILFDTRTVSGTTTTDRSVGHEFEPGEI